MSKDLRTAKVYVSVLGSERAVGGVARRPSRAPAGSSGTGSSRGSACGRCPHLTFHPDRSMAHAAHIQTVLRGARELEERPPEEPGPEKPAGAASPRTCPGGAPARSSTPSSGAGGVLLLAHLYPDGDVLGSQLGLGLALRAAGRTVTFACAHPVPEPFHFLPGAAEVQQWKAGRSEFDLVVALDCPDPARLGGLLDGARGPGDPGPQHRPPRRQPPLRRRQLGGHPGRRHRRDGLRPDRGGRASR